MVGSNKNSLRTEDGKLTVSAGSGALRRGYK